MDNLWMKWKIPLYKVLWDNEDIQAVSKVVKRGMDWAIGPEIEEFEKLLADYVGVDYCHVFNSGTSAGHAALLAVGIKPSDKIIVPSFTFIATANWTLMVGARPNFVDIEEETFGLDPTQLESSITKNTKLVMPIHYGGMPCHMEEIMDVTKKKKILVVEDAAESFGASIKNRKVGTFGDVAILSFAGNKALTTGEGGALITNSKKLYEKFKLLRSHGRLMSQNYFSSNETPNYVSLGYNWRMPSMVAALGISQLIKFEKLIKLRQKNAAYMSTRLSKYGIQVPREPPNYKHVYQLYSVRLPNSKIRNHLMKFLTDKGIMSKIFFEPVHLTRFYKKLGYGTTKLPITEKIYDQILTLPMYPGLTKDEMNFICDSIAEFMEKTKFLS